MSKPKFKISAEAQDKKAVIRIDGYISDWTNHASGFKLKVDALLEQGISEATIYINSGGGDCFQANEISNEIQRFSKTTAQLGALCASAATYIACKCTTAIAAKNTSYMIHKPHGWLQGNSDDLRSYLKLLDNLEKEYAQAYSSKTGIAVDKIKALWKNDYWMDTEELLEKGFINSIDGEADITEEDIQAMASYKGAPKIAASFKPTDTNQKIEIEMKEKLLLVLGSVLAADASEAQIIAHVEAMKTKAAKFETAEEARIKAEKDLNDLKEKALKDAAEAFVQSCVDKKKILASQKDFFVKAYISDAEGTKKTLEDMPAASQLSKETNPSGNAGASAEDRSKWTYADYQDKAPEALAELAESDPDKYEQLFKAHYKN